MIHVHPNPPYEREGWTRLSARVEGLGKGPDTLWFDVENERAHLLTELADPFVLGTLFLALESGMGLQIHGRVSFQLLRNLEYFQALWSAWMPNLYQPVPLAAEEEVRGVRREEGHSITAFSGGLDSAYTARRHALGTVGRRSEALKAGVMVLGFDIALEREEWFEGASAGSRAMLESLGIELWRMRTNYRAFRTIWIRSHGAGLAAALQCFAGGCSRALVASSAYTGSQGRRRPGSSRPVNGSHVLTDPLFSSHLMEIIHDGSETPRFAKPPLIADWPEGMAHLRVCWETDRPDSNCGHCDKCLLTGLAFMANGLPVPASLGATPTPRDLAKLRLAKPHEVRFAKRLLELAGENGEGATPAFDAVRSALRRRRLRAAMDRVRPGS